MTGSVAPPRSAEGGRPAAGVLWPGEAFQEALGRYHDRGGSPADLSAAYLIAEAARKAGPRVRQGRWPAPLRLVTLAIAPSLRLVAAERLWKVERQVAEGLLAWGEGERRAALLFHVPTPAQILSLQARGVRCVSLLGEGERAAPHADGFAFALHDLCHLEKFADPEHHAGQVGFFSLVQRAVDVGALPAIASRYDAAFRDDWEHVVADMNGSPIFLFAALKMKVKMAERRALARRLGRPPPTGGPLDPPEERAFEAALEGLLDYLGLQGEARAAARSVSTRRDEPAAAAVLAGFFERIGTNVLAVERAAP